VRKVAAGTGIISTVVGYGNSGTTGDGGPATSAEVFPEGLAADAAGNLYIANWPNSIRKVDASTGIITRYAGNGYTGLSGDGGSATMASLCDPGGLASNSSGNIYIADACNYRVREVTFPGPAATPMLSLAAGTYTGTQSVTITDATADAMIYFTTDGSTPSTGSTIYSGAISVGASETLNAIAVAPGYTESAVASAAYVINQPVSPTMTWAPPAAITYGTALSSTQLDATASVPGTFSYSPAAGTVLTAGNQTLTATFTPTDTTDYTTATATVTLVVNQAVPAISWATPAAINYGTTLSSTQLDATASVPGTFVYSPAAGTVPAAGSDTLSVTFIPTDSTDYTQALATVTLVVNPENPAPGIGSISPALTDAGAAAFTLTVDGANFVSSSTVYWGSTALTTQFVSATQLTAQVPASAIAATGIFAVTVQTPSPGGGASTSFQFEVDSAGATPPVFATAAATVAAGSTATYTVTLPSSATNVTAQCLNLPVGASCSYSAGAGAVSIATSSTTPNGTYQITIVFTETLSGAASAVIFLPILLLPLFYFKRRLTKGAWITVGIVVLGTGLVCATGCGGGSGGSPSSPATHQVTSSGVVTLTVQ
jgi:Chitobiase/beta-hexosaminidase C-terminal domain/NHL repeat